MLWELYDTFYASYVYPYVCRSFSPILIWLNFLVLNILSGKMLHHCIQQLTQYPMWTGFLSQPFFYFTKLMEIQFVLLAVLPMFVPWKCHPHFSTVKTQHLTWKHRVRYSLHKYGLFNDCTHCSSALYKNRMSILSWHLRGFHHNFLSHKGSDHLIFKAIWEITSSAEENDW